MKLSKKILTEKEADDKIQCLFQNLGNWIENIQYWDQRIGKELKPIDVFILHTDNFTSPEEAIAESYKRIEYIRFKIYLDYGRFCKIKNRVG